MYHKRPGAVIAQPAQQTQALASPQRCMANQTLSPLGVAVAQAHALDHTAFINGFDPSGINLVEPVQKLLPLGEHIFTLSLSGHYGFFFRV